MLTFRRPDERRLDDLVRTEAAQPFTYPVGLTRLDPRPRRWFIEDLSAPVGVGRPAFDEAGAALRAWEQSDLGWFIVHRPQESPLEPGRTVAYSAHVLGLWWSYCCRIVEVVDEERADGSRQFGFTYGTVGSHAERGEERFLLTLDAATLEVRFSVLAISRPGRWFTVAGLPLARRAQRAFKPDALAAMAGAVRRRTTPT